MAVRFLASVATLVYLGHASLDQHEQIPLQSSRPSPTPASRALKGKFLHITGACKVPDIYSRVLANPLTDVATDIHPDPYYQVYSSTEGDSACHRSHGPAGAYGAETSDCDSPYTLVNATFEWLAHNLREEIDFVIWTGDSARHDNDENLPRSRQATLQQNQMLVDKMFEVFGKPGDSHNNDYVVPIIPTFGNNDILPHNIFSPGPNQWTAEYSRIWHSFIPEEQRHQFDRGGWFYVEAIPNQLAVFSLNTMYYFDSNAAVDGCAASEPGGEQFQWLRIQLQLLRMRGLKAILTGHVPPARSNDEGGKTLWDETCWQRHALWLHQYRDVIVGSIYGHMNVEHFLLQDFADIKWKVASDGLDSSESDVEEELSALQALWDKPTFAARDDRISIAGTEDYLNALREQWRQLPDVSFGFPTSDSSSKKGRKLKNALGGPWAERFAITHVSASVVPNYFPTIRVFDYNITGLEGLTQPVWSSAQSARLFTYRDDLSEPLSGTDFDDESGDDSAEDVDAAKHKKHKKKKKKKKKKKPKKPKFTVPDGPSKLAPPGPAYSPQTLSLLGYTQYFANLTRINNDFTTLSGSDLISSGHQQLHDEDALYRSPTLWNGTETALDDAYVDPLRWRPGKHHEKRPKHPAPHPLDFDFEVEYNTSESGDIYGLATKKGGLIVRNYVELASRIGKYRPSKDDTLLFDDVSRDEEAIDQDDWVLVDSQGEVETSKQKKRKKRRIVNKTWYAFVDRATVATMDPSEIHKTFGDPVVDGARRTDQECMDVDTNADTRHEESWFAQVWRDALLRGWGI